MSIGRIIFRICVVVAVLASMIAGIAAVHKRAVPVPCERVEIIIRDSIERQFVTEKEIETKVERQKTKDQTMAQIPYQGIEEALKAHPMIRTAQCYGTPKGVLYVEVEQRQPLFTVVTENETYWVDTEHEVMPYKDRCAQGQKTAALKDERLMEVKGVVTKTMACRELAELVEWIYGSEYWRDKIERVQVKGPQDIRLKQRNGMTLLIGKPERLAQKMHKLEVFYEKTSFPQDSVPYRELDVRYKGQVVGRK